MSPPGRSVTIANRPEWSVGNFPPARAVARRIVGLGNLGVHLQLGPLHASDPFVAEPCSESRHSFAPQTGDIARFTTRSRKSK